QSASNDPSRAAPPSASCEGAPSMIDTIASIRCNLARFATLMLGCGFFLTPAAPALAQGWLPWGGFFDGPPPRYYNSPPRYYERSPRRYERERSDRRERRVRLVEEIKDGGAQPKIAPKAPPVVAFPYSYPVASIIIDTHRRKLYYVVEEGRAYEYPIA